MFRHVVMFRFKPGTSDAQKQAVRDGLFELPQAIPEIRNYDYGDDAGLVEGNFDFAVVADFENVDGFEVYTDHPAHQKVLRERIRPVLAERCAVQFHV